MKRVWLLGFLLLGGCVRHEATAPLPDASGAAMPSPATPDVPSDYYDEIDTIEI